MIKNKISHISIELLETEFKAVMEKFDDLIYFQEAVLMNIRQGHLQKVYQELIQGKFQKNFRFTKSGEQKNLKRSKIKLSRNTNLEVKN